MRSISFLGLLAALILPTVAAPGDELALLGELPLSGAAGDLSPRHLEAGGRAFLVSVAGGAIETWPGRSVSEPLVSPGPGAPLRGRPAFGDFDGDGRLDVAASVVGGIHVFSGDGAGRFRVAVVIPSEGVRALAAGDVDGDGRDDLVAGAASPSGDVLQTLRSLGSFVFDAPRISTGLPDGSVVVSLTAGDLDGDGRSDVVVIGSSAAPSVWISRGDGTFALSQPSVNTGAGGVAILADLDRDGLSDLVLASPFLKWTSVATFRNEGGGRFRALPFAVTSSFGGRLAVGDFDGDGSADIATVPATEAPCGSTLTVYPGDGHGGFGPPRLRSIPCVPALDEVGGLEAVDWDGDGTDEVAAETPRGPILLASPRMRYDDVLVVPVLVSTSGVGGVRFESDLLVTNTGTTRAHLALRYVATVGGGSGTVAAELEPGAQLYAASALGHLRAAGLPISDTGPAIGTLRIDVSGASGLHVVGASVLTRSSAGGGVSMAASTRAEALRGSAVVPWLTETERDRTNLALVNAGAAEDGPVTLRVTVLSGDPAVPGTIELPDVELPPGGFRQLDRVLLVCGLPSRLGWARIRRVAGNAPYLAWATVNDAVSGDGSVVAAVSEDAPWPWHLQFPSAVQSERFATELVLTNPGEEAVRATVALGGSEALTETLAPGQTLYLEDLFAELRRRGLSGMPAAGVPYVGPLYVSGGIGGLRVSTTRVEGRFGVFEAPMPTKAASVVLTDLRRDAATRTNLAVVNGHGFGPGPDRFRLELYDGDSGRLSASRELEIAHDARLQVDDVLRDLAPSVSRAWARIVPGFPTLFSAYAVVMDGAAPGEGTDDGALVPGVPEETPPR